MLKNPLDRRDEALSELTAALDGCRRTYARLAREKGYPVTIVSSDKDLMQLVRDGVRMFDPMKYKYMGEAEVLEKFGVPPEKVVDVQALAGDSVDNVPGVPGIGLKTAAQLINEYGDLETLLAKAGGIKQPKRREVLTQHAEDARISKKLVALVRVTVSSNRKRVTRPDTVPKTSAFGVAVTLTSSGPMYWPWVKVEARPCSSRSFDTVALPLRNTAAALTKAPAVSSFRAPAGKVAMTERWSVEDRSASMEATGLVAPEFVR